jgi:hypothetical protein
MTNSQPVPAQPGGGGLRNLRKAVTRRWPALLGATIVTVAVPLVAFAAQEFGTSEFSSSDGLTVNIFNTHFPTGGTALRASSSGTAIEASGHVGLDALGTGADGAGVRAHEINATGIDAVSQNAVAIKADGKTVGVQAVARGSDLNVGVGVDAEGNKTGVKATSTYSVGLEASGFTAVQANTPGAVSGSPAAGSIGVKTNADTGIEVHGKTTGVRASSDGTAVTASTSAVNGRALFAYADRAGSDGIDAFGDKTALSAEGKTGIISHGYAGVGGDFSGTAAPIRLAPATTAGAPQKSSGAHEQGELYVDSNGVLFICSSAGTPGIWVKVGSQ